MATMQTTPGARLFEEQLLPDGDRNSLPPETDQYLRNAPVQARSTARLDALLDAAAKVVDEIGYERLTTAQVAEVAGASIGTVYRYFPDRLALLRALRSRNVRRYMQRLTETFDEAGDLDLLASADRTVDVYVSMFRNEPGFRAVRFTDVAGDRAAGLKPGPVNGVIAGYFVQRYLDLIDPADEDEVVFRLEIVIEMGEAILSRAFSDPANVDNRFIDEYHDVTRNYINKHIIKRFFPAEAATDSSD